MNGPSLAPPLRFGLRFRLSLMMFLQYAAPGAWVMVLRDHLIAAGFGDAQVGAVFGTFALGTILSPMLVGELADRRFRSERLLAVLQIAAAGLLVCLSRLDAHTRFAGLDGAELVYAVALAHSLIFAPTWVLAYTISFRHLPDSTRDLPTVRLFGTIGWIVAGLIVGRLLGPEATGTDRPLLLGAAFSAALAVFCIALPATPPGSRHGGPLPFLRAVRLLGRPRFAVFFAAGFLIAVVAAFYNPFAAGFLRSVGVADPSGLLTVGQVSETALMAALPMLIPRLGFKAVLMLGMAAWAARCGLFAVGSPFPLVVAGIALHGVCYAFFRESGILMLKSKTTDDIRGSAQALYLLLSDGVGSLCGSALSGLLVHRAANGAGDVNWSAVWVVPGFTALACLVLFGLLFRLPPDAETPPADPARAA